MRSTSGTLVRTVGLGGLAAVSGATVAVAGGAAAGTAMAVLGATVALAGLLPVLLPIPARAHARVTDSHSAAQIRRVSRTAGLGSRGAARAAEVKRHTSMICP